MGLGSREGLADVDPGLKEADLVSVQTVGMVDHKGGVRRPLQLRPLWIPHRPPEISIWNSTGDSTCADRRIREWFRAGVGREIPDARIVVT
jgi:hypothetical protein